MNHLIALITCTLMLAEGCRQFPASGSGDADCARFYTQDSIWNIPIDWQRAQIHPQSKEMMGAFFQSASWIGTDATQYSANVYFVTSKTPLVPVKLTYSFRDASSDEYVRMGRPGETVYMPLPPGAVPAPGTDGQMVVVNLETGEEWGLNKGRIASDGSWSAGGAYLYRIDNSGVPPEGFGQRGAAIGQLAGIVRRCEIERGHIDHAVTLAYDFPCSGSVCKANGWPVSIPPFTDTDGTGRSPYDIPEGARLAIRPEITREQIAQACRRNKACIVWTLNMQEYGGFVVDCSGHPKSYAEGDATAHWDPKLWSKDILRYIPPEWYVVIDWNHPATKAGY
jgi:hypothetical protein